MAYRDSESNVYPLKTYSPGYATLLILLLLITFSGLGMEVYLKASVENRMIHRETQSRQALYAALGGIEWAKAHLRINPGLRQGNFSLSTGSVLVTIEESTGVYKVISEGRSGVAFRKIEEKLQWVNGKWFIQSYQELHR